MEIKDVKVGDRVAFHRSTAFDIVKGVEYEVISADSDGFTFIDGAGDEQFFFYSSGEYDIFENNGGNFSYEDLKIGDKLRFVKMGKYVGIEDLIGDVLIIDGKNEEGIFYTKGFGSFPTWNIHKEETHLYELLEDEESPDNKPSSIELIANLAQEVAKLKRELNELREGVQAQAHEDSERIERILDDIVMLDERTQGANNGGQKLLSKEVYIYDTE